MSLLPCGNSRFVMHARTVSVVGDSPPRFPSIGGDGWPFRVQQWCTSGVPPGDVKIADWSSMVHTLSFNKAGRNSAQGP